MPIFTRGPVSVLYIHVPKTGGTAIEHFFAENGFRRTLFDAGGKNGLNYLRRCSPQHFHRAMLESFLRFEKFSAVLMTVRHPVARMKCEYLMRNRTAPRPDPDAWVARQLEAYAGNPWLHDNHIRPQSDFLCPGAQVRRLEDGFGGGWVEELSATLGCTLEGAVARRRVRSELDNVSSADVPFAPQTEAMLRTFYDADFAAFGYR